MPAVRWRLALYVFSPAVVRVAVAPNDEVLAMWGLYGLVYTAMGVAHAMQGPRRKWRPRIVLLTVALGLTAAAHLLAAMLGFAAAVVFMLYLAGRRRADVTLVLLWAALGALVMEFAAFSFKPAYFTYVFTGGAGRFWVSLAGLRFFGADQANWPLLLAAGVALGLYVGYRRSRYFGNTAPLLMVLGLLFLVTTQVRTDPVIWALPFLFTFIAGVFADALETPQRKWYLATVGLLVAMEAAGLWSVLPMIAQG